MRSTSSGLLLLLVGVVLLSAFVNGALPRLLNTLFSAGPATGTAAGSVPARAGLPSVGTGQTSAA